MGHAAAVPDADRRKPGPEVVRRMRLMNSIHPVSYIMGEFVDSSDMTHYKPQQYHDRAPQYLSALGGKVDIWEVGNEVSGSWTGNYSDVSAKIYDAWQQVHAAGKRSVLTLWFDAGCGNGPSELDPIATSRMTCATASITPGELL